MPDIKVRVGQQNAIKVVASSFGGSLTAENAANATNVLGGIASVTQIINSGVTTLTGPVRLGSTLDVSGISTFSSLGVSGLTTTKDLLVTGIATIAGATISGGAFEQLQVTGVSTIGITSATWLEAQQLNVTGVSTFAGYVGLSTGLTVAGVTTFNQDVQFPGAAYNILWDQATSKFKFDDSAQAVWGSASGGDLKIFHQSGNSTIRNETGQFRIAGNDIRLQTQNHSEDYLLAVDGGSVSIFFNDVKRLETTPSGVNITDTLNVAGVSTFVGDAQFDGNVSVAGTITHEDVTNIDSVGLITARSGVRITDGGLVVTAGISTFGGRIVGAATSNVIPFLYSNFSDLPSASTYHGAFAHVHARGKGYFAHSSNWYELVNKEINGTIGVGTERYNIGPTNVTTLNISGVSTFVGVVTTSSDLYIGGDLYIKDDLTFDEFTAASGNITGILTAATANVTGTLTAGLIDGGSY